MKYLFLVLTIAFSTTCLSAPVKRWQDGYSLERSSEVIESKHAVYSYWSRDVRRPLDGPSVSFDCKVTSDEMVGYISWADVTEQYPFNGEAVEAHFYVNEKFIFQLEGKNVASHEGEVFLNSSELKTLVDEMGRGKMMDVIILNAEKSIETHIVLSLDGFETNHPLITACF